MQGAFISHLSQHARRWTARQQRLLQFHATMAVTWQWLSPLVPASLVVPGTWEHQRLQPTRLCIHPLHSQLLECVCCLSMIKVRMQWAIQQAQAGRGSPTRRSAGAAWSTVMMRCVACEPAHVCDNRLNTVLLTLQARCTREDAPEAAGSCRACSLACRRGARQGAKVYASQRLAACEATADRPARAVACCCAAQRSGAARPRRSRTLRTAGQRAAV